MPDSRISPFAFMTDLPGKSSNSAPVLDSSVVVERGGKRRPQCSKLRYNSKELAFCIVSNCGHAGNLANVRDVLAVCISSLLGNNSVPVQWTTILC
jgi:hypothetical protein